MITRSANIIVYRRYFRKYHIEPHRYSYHTTRTRIIPSYCLKETEIWRENHSNELRTSGHFVQSTIPCAPAPSTPTAATMGKKWLPLESNPEVMATFAHTYVTCHRPRFPCIPCPVRIDAPTAPRDLTPGSHKRGHPAWLPAARQEVSRGGHED